MYSIFSTKIKKQSYLEEGEPPPKKLVTEEDLLIKELTKNQLKTSTTLTEQLSTKKEFTPSESFTNITGHVSGKTELKDFQMKVADVDELSSLKSKGLSDEDVKMYREYKQLGAVFWETYKSINEDVLYQRINGIRALVASCSDNAQDTLKKDFLPGPMDELPSLEEDFSANVEKYSSVDIKKIRKKARSMGNKLNNLETAMSSVNTRDCNKTVTNNKPTQWDIKDKPDCFQQRLEIIDKDKLYGCKPQNWYTINNGKISKLDKYKALPKTNQNVTEKSKLTLEEIKNIPKFANYDSGTPSKVLYVKNLGRNVTEDCLKMLLNQFKGQYCSVKVMGGKMKGQAFIEFQDAIQASEALNLLNGLILEKNPIIVQFGKKNCDLK